MSRNGTVFKRPGSANFVVRYKRRGRWVRESSHSTKESTARKFLAQRLKEVGAEEIGARPFIGPDQERMTVTDLLEDLEQDLKIRHRFTAQTKSHLKAVKDQLGWMRAVQVTPETIDRAISAWRQEGSL